MIEDYYNLTELEVMGESVIFAYQPDPFIFYQEEKGFKSKCSWDNPNESGQKEKVRGKELSFLDLITLEKLKS